MNTTLRNEKQLKKIQKKIDFLQMYKVEEVNDYCFAIVSDFDSITGTLVELIESMGYRLLHIQLKEERPIARFTYK